MIPLTSCLLHFDISRLLCFLLILLSTSLLDVDGYSQVATSGNDNGPKIFKAINMDLLFPKTFNSSENIVSTTQSAVHQNGSATPFSSVELPPTQVEQSAVTAPQPPADQYINSLAESTGRAGDYRPAYSFGQLVSPPSRPILKTQQPGKLTVVIPSSPSSSSSSSPVYVRRPSIFYPNNHQAARQPPSRAEIDKLSGKGKINDRFTPAEAVASSHFQKGYTQSNPKDNPTSASQLSSYEQTYVPPKNLYSFPPNINVNYPSPSDDKPTDPPKDTHTSYLAPASGPLQNTDYSHEFVGPVSPEYLPAHMKAPIASVDDDKKSNANDADADTNGDDNIGVLPASFMKDADGGVDSPSTGKGNVDSIGPVAAYHGHDPNLHGYDTDKDYPTPPPGWLEEHPQDDHHDQQAYQDDHRHHHHDQQPKTQNFPSHPSFHSFDHNYPEIIYDDHHHDQHFHHAEPPPLTTTEAPQPRVKKYSYFYIGRKLWYIPLYFTVWFSFYVLWLILKSIARHKVNLPNHYVAKRSIINDYTHRQATERIDRLTASVMDKIERFKDKYHR